MKNSQFLQLIKTELRGNVLVWLLCGLFLSGVDFVPLTQMFALQPDTNAFRGLIMFMGVLAVFENSFGNKRSANYDSSRSLEFFFTKAISRDALINAKICVYLVVCLLPMGLTLAATYATMPGVKVSFYRNSAGEKETKQFYLTQFDGAQVEQDQSNPDKYYVTLPKGRVDQVFLGFVSVCATTLAYLLAYFLFWKSRWGKVAVVSALLMVQSLASRWLNSIIPKYPMRVVWVSHHMLLTLMGLILVAIAIHAFCSRRFVKTEILA